jgi:hypothetical protein
MRRAAAVSLAATTLLLAAAAPPAASPASKQKLDPPTLLWKSFPLEPQQMSQARKVRAPALRVAIAQQVSGRSGQPYLLVLTLLLLIAMMLAAAAVVVTQTPAPGRIGTLGGTRRRRRPRRVAASPPRRAIVAEPLDPVSVESEDEPVEAPPGPPPGAVRNVPLELVLLRLVERINAAPAGEHDELRQRMAEVSAEIGARPPTQRELEQRREYELRQLADAAEARAEPWAAPRPATPTEAVVSCEIRLWQDFTRCQLYAASGISEEAVALSRFFRLRDSEAPNEKAFRVLSDFLARLARDGWTVVARGPSWYDHRLERPVAPRPPSLRPPHSG